MNKKIIGNTVGTPFNPNMAKPTDNEIKQAVDKYLAENPPAGVVEETDPTVPAWAKAETKPTYTAAEVGARSNTWMPTASEVGAVTDEDVKARINTHNSSEGAHTGIRNRLKAVEDDKADRTELPTLSDLGGITPAAAEGMVSAHNVNGESHNDLRLALSELSARLNAALDSEDVDLNQLSEIVAYIKSNKALIEAITTSKVSVTNIVNDLVTNVTNKPLSAAQGVALKTLIDAVTTTANNAASEAGKAKTAAAEATTKAENAQAAASEAKNTAIAAGNTAAAAQAAATEANTKAESAQTAASEAKTAANNAQNNLTAKLDASKLPEAINTALAQAKASGEFDGDDGYTPVKGTDYYTPEEKAEFSDYIATELAKRGQLKPEYVNSVEECTDQTKMYVLPDGFIYAFIRTEVEVDGGTKPAFTNLKEQCYIKYGYKFSKSGGGFVQNVGITVVIVPVPIGSTSAVVRFKGVTRNSGLTALYGATSIDAYNSLTITQFGQVSGQPDADGIWTFTATKTADIAYLLFHMNGDTEDALAEMIVTVNEEIKYTTGTETIVTEAFANTGLPFIPADYEDRIISLENKAEAIPENTRRIAELENKVGTVDENAVVHNAVGATYPASQKAAQSEFEGYDIDIYNSMADEVFSYIDTIISGKDTVSKEILGKDASGKYDIARYTYAKREHIAWQRANYPKMYAWKNGTTVIYSVSVSPRKDDTLYSTSYIGTAYGTVTAVNATNRSRTVGGLEFVRYESGDVKPTVFYTDKDDERNSNTSIVHEGITYNRYPLGDLGANRRKLIPVFIYANEHGTNFKGAINTDTMSESKLCGLVATRILCDLATDKQISNPLYKFIRDNCLLVVIPVANPFGFNYNLTADTNTGNSGYNNANNININRNYDTPGWDAAGWGATAGSENETQYIMNTIAESGAVVAMSLHSMGGNKSANRGTCAYQGQQPDGNGYNEEKLAKVISFLKNNYGYNLGNYDSGVAENMPDVTSKSPSYITQCGAYGGIIEFCPADSDKSLEGFVHEMKQKVIENAYAQTINLTAMWLSDYLEVQTDG